MDGVKPTDILNLKVKAVAATRVQQLRTEAAGATRMSRLLLAGTGVEASYTVQVNNSQVPSSSLLAQLQEAVASYAFDDSLHRNALDDGAVALAYTSSEAVREPTVGDDGGGGAGGDDDAGDDEDTASVALSTGAIAGISVGGGVAVLAIALIVSCATKSTNNEKVTPN
jgi:hypothetical protein